MKYFTIFIFLFLSIIASAQLSMEEISYIPSPSGYYTNLVIKGNTNIKNLKTNSFNVQSYASFLNVNIAESSILSISTITVSTGTVALFSDFPASQINSWPVNPHLTKSGIDTSLPINVYMQGGNMSLGRTSSNSNSGQISVDTIAFPSNFGNKTPKLTVKTIDLDYPYNNTSVLVEDLYVMGMHVPFNNCSRLFWSPVYINEGQMLSGVFVLACSNSACVNPEGEELCLQQGKQWNIPASGNDVECTCTSFGTNEEP